MWRRQQASEGRKKQQQRARRRSRLVVDDGQSLRRQFPLVLLLLCLEQLLELGSSQQLELGVRLHQLLAQLQLVAPTRACAVAHIVLCMPSCQLLLLTAPGDANKKTTETESCT